MSASQLSQAEGVPPTSTEYRSGVVLDLDRTELGSGGIKGFLWPISRHEVLSFRDTWVPDLVATIKAARASNEAGADAAMLLSHYLVMESMTLFQAQALVRRLAGQRVVWPAGSRLWRALAEGRSPGESFLAERLRRGPARRAEALEWIAPLARRFRARHCANLRFRAQCPRHGTVTTRFTDPLIRAHAAVQRDPVTHVHISRWFRSTGLDKGKFRSLKDGQLIQSIMASLESAFADQGNRIGACAKEYLQHYLATTVALTDSHLANLRSGIHRLPQELWTGSAGNIWDRALRLATREQGGVVTGHDHATGSGHIDNPWNYFLEFVAADCFVTDHEAKAAAAKEQALRAPLFDNHLPDLQVVNCDFPKLISKPSDQHVRQVMYVSTLYGGESLHLLPLLADIVTLDWQVRLIAHLSDWGYATTHKPHPEGVVAPPAAIGTVKGYEQRSEPFEQIWQEADLLLFDYPSSTTFGFALRSDKPIVLIDSGQFDWLPAARKALHARCAVVTAEFDDENRIAVDWDALRTAIAEAPKRRCNTEFREHFLGA